MRLVKFDKWWEDTSVRGGDLVVDLDRIVGVQEGRYSHQYNGRDFTEAELVLDSGAVVKTGTRFEAAVAMLRNLKPAEEK